MTTTHRSLWIAVALGIAGLTTGYTLFLSQHTTVAAAARECPLKAACAGGECEKCTGENCAKHCNCAKKKTS